MFVGDFGADSERREERLVVSLSTVLDEIIVSELSDDPSVNLASWTWIPRRKIGLSCYLEIMDKLGEVLFYKFSIKLMVFLLIQIIQRRAVNVVEVEDKFGTIIVRPGVSIHGTWSLYVLVYMAGVVYSLLVYIKEQYVCRFLLVQNGSAAASNSHREWCLLNWGGSSIWCIVVGVLSRFCEIVDVIMFSYLSSQYLQPSQTALFFLVRLSFATIQVRSFLAAGNVSFGFTEEDTPESTEIRDSRQASGIWSPDQPLPPSSSFHSITSQEKENDSCHALCVEAESHDSEISHNIRHRHTNTLPQSLSFSQFTTLSRDYQDMFTLCKFSQTFFSQGLAYYFHPELSHFYLKNLTRSFSPQNPLSRVRIKPFKVLQLADLAFYLDLFSLENVLDRLYIINKHKETHEFNISTYYIWKVLSHDLIMNICKLFFLVFVSRLSRGYLILTLAISSLNILSLFFYLHVNKQVINDVVR